jgi:hypothetical protein
MGRGFLPKIWIQRAKQLENQALEARDRYDLSQWSDQDPKEREPNPSAPLQKWDVPKDLNSKGWKHTSGEETLKFLLKGSPKRIATADYGAVAVQPEPFSSILGLTEWEFRNWVRFTYEHVID